ncbi:MAG: efflux RND transporter periplasmic adaptor subunit, partial [Burkholderiales bacterium]|nr:efflux RND transporter periplasmic adaptor subunit [Burkholderiales bacterium]
MNKKPLIAIAVVALLAAGAYLGWREHGGGAPAIDALYGNVDIRDVDLAFRVGGRVAEVRVDEGDRIQPGQTLAMLDAAPLRNQLQAAQAQLAAVAARNALLHAGYRREDIAQAQARAEAARAALHETEIQLARQQAMVPAGATPQRALDSARTARDQAAANVAAADAALREARRGYRRQEIAESDARLQQARASVATARLALDDAVLVAPDAGVVLTRAVERGSMVAPGSPAFSVSLMRPVWVRAYVSEPQLGQYASGTAVTLSTDSRPGRAYHG